MNQGYQLRCARFATVAMFLAVDWSDASARESSDQTSGGVVPSFLSSHELENRYVEYQQRFADRKGAGATLDETSASADWTRPRTAEAIKAHEVTVGPEARYPVDINYRDIGGVSVAVITPKSAVPKLHRDRLLINPVAEPPESSAANDYIARWFNQRLDPLNRRSR